MQLSSVEEIIHGNSPLCSNSTLFVVVVTLWLIYALLLSIAFLRPAFHWWLLSLSGVPFAALSFPSFVPTVFVLSKSFPAGLPSRFRSDIPRNNIFASLSSSYALMSNDVRNRRTGVVPPYHSDQARQLQNT
jgi:hypothetical protein